MSTMSRLKKRPGRSTTVTFPWSPDDAERHQQLTSDLSRAKVRLEAAERRTDAPDVAGDVLAAEEAVTAAEDALRAFYDDTATIVFHLRSCGSKAAEKLMLTHPPSADQQKRFADARRAAGDKPGLLQFDDESFPPALIAACCERVDVTGEDEPIVDVTADDLREMFDGQGWSTGDIETLFTHCQVLCQFATAIQRDQIDRLGKG